MSTKPLEGNLEKLTRQSSADNDRADQGLLLAIQSSIKLLHERAESMSVDTGTWHRVPARALDLENLRWDFAFCQMQLALALRAITPTMDEEVISSLVMRDTAISKVLALDFRSGGHGSTIDWSRIKMTAVELQQKIGERIAATRKAKNFTQQSLAEMVKMSAPSITRIEAGKQRLGMSVLYAIAAAMQVSPATFLPKEAFPPKASKPAKIPLNEIRRMRRSSPELDKVMNRLEEALRKTKL